MSDDKPWTTRSYWNERFLTEDTPWDMGEASPTLVELERRAELLPESTVLVPGCGLGHDALHFARLGYKVSAVDWSKQATDHLRIKARREGLSLEILQSDFWLIPETWSQSFDLWVEHTFFCAIDRLQRPAYVEQVLRLLKKGGHFLAALFVTEDPDKVSLFPEGGPPFWVTPEELHALFDPHFDWIRFEPSPVAHPGRMGKEYWVHLKRKVPDMLR